MTSPAPSLEGDGDRFQRRQGKGYNTRRYTNYLQYQPIEESCPSLHLLTKHLRLF